MYLGKKGYTIPKNDISVNDILEIKKTLKVKPNVNPGMMGTSFDLSFPIYRESNTKLYVPRYFGEDKYGILKNKKIDDGKDIDLTFKGSLFDYQENIVSKFVNHIIERNNSGGGLLDVEPGKGKTVMALAILCKLKKKTLIVVHKTFLMNQWEERIAQFIPSAKVGKIQGKIIDVNDKDIVLGMLQSLCKPGNYDQSIFNDFGLSIYDECHHLSAEGFSNCLNSVVTNYTLGLSGTMTRKDGLTKVFKWFLGPVIHKEHSKKDVEVLVKSVFYNANDDEFNNVITDFRGQVMYSSMVTKLCNYEYRSLFIIDILKYELNKNNDQQIMILSQNKSLIFFLEEKLIESNIDVGLYLGGMKEDKLKLSENKKVILATYSMASEGLDIKTLTTLIMATPKSDVCQSVGRILRQKHSNPLVIDIIDKHQIFKNQYKKREKYYKKQNYKISIYNNVNYFNKENSNNFDLDENENYEELSTHNECLINLDII
tara:strand:- start:2614 stop:4068 length:1455 start_codon:yes stop_codon:yes gene_type:complete